MPIDTSRQLDYHGIFKLVNKVAEGGMATVYEAQQLGPSGFAKRIALKVIHPHYAQRPEFLQLFIDEAKLSANLLHGNIVQIYQLGEVAGDYFIAMEFIPGPTLRSIIDRHRDIGRAMPQTLAAYIASRVCRALDFAHNFVGPDGHRLDIVHRDVSPGNVMVTWDGHIKLADFGIAKARTSIDPASDGIRIGKKHYMSPEQLTGLDVDGRSDVFSLGLVLYELLALERLFREDITAKALSEVALEPLPAIRDLVSNLDEDLERIILAALERDPARRPTAALLGQALDQWVFHQQEVATPDKLEAHLAQLFPGSYQPPTVDEEETEFTNLKAALNRSWWKKGLGVRG
ncbi:MAG TPA: serine/threonine-protein kinase [Gemmatimonadaceae bacterium]|nr:serine/threonine-protein kinase [Gemmatimonadaceae bacterium]